MAYESHLAPPPHLVGLRVAALDALLAARRPGRPRRRDGQPVVVVSAVALSEKVPDPQLRPHSFTLRVGELLDLDECAASSSAPDMSTSTRCEERGQFAMRGGLLDVFPATEERAVRVDMFDVEIESLRWFSTFTQRSLGDVRAGRDRAGGRARASSTASWQRSRRRRAPSTQRRGPERPDIAELLPVERFGAAARPGRRPARRCMVAAEEELQPALPTTGATSARRSATATRTTCT